MISVNESSFFKVWLLVYFNEFLGCLNFIFRCGDRVYKMVEKLFYTEILSDRTVKNIFFMGISSYRTIRGVLFWYAPEKYEKNAPG